MRWHTSGGDTRWDSELSRPVDERGICELLGFAFPDERSTKDQKEYRDFWEDAGRTLLEKNQEGFRPVDVGPVVMGERANSSRSGQNVYQSLVYTKGAYILHMLEMLYWTPQYGDKPFKAAMHDFVKSTRTRPATTEDFKASMEKNMPPWLDVDKNHKLDWFFDAYVYGTEVPKYTVTSEFTKNGGETTAHFKVTQAGVSPNFEMLVPLYIELADKKVSLLGQLVVRGSSTVEETVKLGKVPGTPTRIVANYNYDLLSD